MAFDRNRAAAALCVRWPSEADGCLMVYTGSKIIYKEASREAVIHFDGVAYLHKYIGSSLYNQLMS